MNSIVVYTSQTGFTEKYAKVLGEKLGAEIISLDKAKKQPEELFADADVIVYGGWVMAGKVVGSEWLLGHLDAWKEKKMALMCVGASPATTPDVRELLKRAVPVGAEECIKPFYCQGGINYDKMTFPMKMLMKTLVKMWSGKKATKDQKDMAARISKSYDDFDEKFLEPIVEYING